MTLTKLIKQFFVFWAVLMLTIIFFTDFKIPDSVAISDYLMTFHTAGWIADHGLWSRMYPADGAVTFAGTPFDKTAHELLQRMPSSSVAEYMYMPVSAYVFALYSRLEPAFSLFAWQITSLAATFTAAWLLFQNESERKPVGKALTAACAALTFFPAMFTLWIGQVGLVFGLLPLCLGYHLLGKNRNMPEFSAGLAFSLLLFKPQMLVPALFMCAGRLAQKKWRSAAGMFIGALLILIINAGFLGPELFAAWLKCVQLSDKIYSDPSHGVAVHLATSLPRAILLSQPLQLHAVLKPVLYGAALILLGAGLIISMRFSQSSAVSDRSKLNLTFLLGLLALPVVVPHLFLYDLCVIAPSGFLLWGEAKTALSEQPHLQLFFTRTIALLWLAITVYCTLMICNQHLAKPLVLVSLLGLSYCLALYRVFLSSSLKR